VKNWPLLLLIPVAFGVVWYSTKPTPPPPPEFQGTVTRFWYKPQSGLWMVETARTGRRYLIQSASCCSGDSVFVRDGVPTLIAR